MPQQYLCLRAEWLQREYHGAEWPPAPARLFQALLAGLMTGGNREQAKGGAEEALRWLETLPPPLIVCGPSRRLTEYRIAAPNNDLDKWARSMAKGEYLDAAKFKTMKAVNPRRLEVETAHVSYWWAIPEGAEEMPARLKPVAHCLHTLGWGRDMAYADLSVEPEVRVGQGELWQPVAKGGTLLAVPVAGLLEDLKEVYRRHTQRIGATEVNSNTRMESYRLERYAPAGKKQAALACFEMVQLAGERNYSHPGWRSQDVAAWVRHAALEALKREGLSQWGEYVSGHGEDGNLRVSFVPLLSVGHANADGRVRRVLITEPAEATGEVTEFLGRVLDGAVLVDDRGQARCQLAAVSRADRMVERYLGTARKWRSVTPVILNGYNSLRGQINLKKTDQLVRQALGKGGFPNEMIDEVFVQAAPWAPNTPAARESFRAQHLRKWPSYHVEVRFRSSVAGPVLAGIGRHVGLGLFVPVTD
jgi:CRISPR-associated protein Csb2